MPCETSLSSLGEILEEAFAQLAQGRFENAIDRFSEYLLIEGNEPRAYEGRALAHFQIKNWNTALSDFRKATELNPGEPENWVGLGLTLAMLNEIYPAIHVFEDLI